MRRFLCTIILSLFCLSVVLAADSRYVAHSALSSGRWVKVSVDANGVYKLTESQLKQMGFQDISKVSVCGYGGWPQPVTRLTMFRRLPFIVEMDIYFSMVKEQ